MELVIKLMKSMGVAIVITLIAIFGCGVILWVVNNDYIFTLGPIAILALVWRIVYNKMYQNFNTTKSNKLGNER